MFENKTSPNLRGCVIFTEVLVNTPVIDHYIVSPLINVNLKEVHQKPYLIDTLMEKVLEANEVKAHKNILDAIKMCIRDSPSPMTVHPTF